MIPSQVLIITVNSPRSLSKVEHHSQCLCSALVNRDLSQNSKSSTPYDLNDEALQEPFFNPVFSSALLRGIELAKAAVTAIDKFDGASESESHILKLRRDANALAQFQCSDNKTIAILGASGEGQTSKTGRTTSKANSAIGKSSLINSLLHCPGLAKTVSQSPCS